MFITEAVIMFFMIIVAAVVGYGTGLFVVWFVEKLFDIINLKEKNE